MKRNIIITYRGIDESNKIASSTKNYIERINPHIDNFFKLSMVNLDKRNLKKFIEKLKDSKDTIIYVYYDEENLLTMLELEKYKNLAIRQYKIKNNKWHNAKGIYNKLGKQIFQEYKNSLKTFILWMKYEDKAIKIFINEYDYKNLSKNYIFFKTKKECIESILIDFKFRYKNYLSMINYYKEKIKNNEEKINDYEDLLKKINNNHYQDNKEAINILDFIKNK